MEIERYTLATGETAVTGFTRLWKPWGVLFIAMTVIAVDVAGLGDGRHDHAELRVGVLRGR